MHNISLCTQTMNWESFELEVVLHEFLNPSFLIWSVSMRLFLCLLWLFPRKYPAKIFSHCAPFSQLPICHISPHQHHFIRWMTLFRLLQYWFVLFVYVTFVEVVDDFFVFQCNRRRYIESILDSFQDVLDSQSIFLDYICFRYPVDFHTDIPSRIAIMRGFTLSLKHLNDRASYLEVVQLHIPYGYECVDLSLYKVIDPFMLLAWNLFKIWQSWTYFCNRNVR